jgi:hypothetical protein
LITPGMSESVFDFSIMECFDGHTLGHDGTMHFPASADLIRTLRRISRAEV